MTPPMFTPAAAETADQLIQMALLEDLDAAGDLTSQATVPADAMASVNVVARETGFLCGGVLIERVYAALQARQAASSAAPPVSDVGGVQVDVLIADGRPVSPQEVIATVSGSVRTLLTGERVALNFLIHLSGIASRTAEFVQLVAGSEAVILDTRKTLPGYRHLHKYAVKCGGGTNHRMGLYDGMLIKDNHLAARETSVATAVESARDYLSTHAPGLPVEVEVDTLEQLQDALAARPEIVLLDNMKTTQLQQAVRLRDELSPHTQLEASGGVNRETVGCIAGSGVDRISIGGLTHSAPALDIGYDWAWQDGAS